MKEKVFSISSYWTDKPSHLATPFRFFKNKEKAEKETEKLNKQQEGHTTFRYLIETFCLE